MGSPYRQFCPVSKAMELLDERWTMLVVRELVIGSERFNDLRRGLPRMSPTLLSRRLQQLERAGVVERIADGKDVRYVLTEAGHELRPVVDAVVVPAHAQVSPRFTTTTTTTTTVTTFNT